MRIVRIPKRRGEYRIIYVPARSERKVLRKLAVQLEKSVRRRERALMKKVGLTEPFLHGFVRGRSAVTNALAHVGKAWSVCFDLKDFFDSVTGEHLRAKVTGHHQVLKDKTIEMVLVDGAPRQGLSTSPHVANLAALKHLDERILMGILSQEENHGTGRIGKLSQLLVYTRYADDLTISGDRLELLPIAMQIVEKAVEAAGFRLNTRKTSKQFAKNGNRVITGVSVGRDSVKPTRKLRRRLRAALHQNPESSHAKGLAEWAKLRLPAGYTEQHPMVDLARVMIDE